ncbi:MAG: type IV pilus twitching motility protein PilT [Planctomycetota bacterium]|jgi:twitching motility protein PilT
MRLEGIVDLLALLEQTVERNASDLHLKVGRPPLFRVSGELVAEKEYPPLAEEEIKDALFGLTNENVTRRFIDELEADMAYDYEGRARFRINMFFQRGKVGAVLRRIPIDIPSLESLGLPVVLKEIALRNQGWILVAGPTGSGKSTTMSSMVEYINQNRACHVVTIEDPIEFIYTDKKATINQRQIGADTLSFSEALRRVLRQDPDVILMGEMRDATSMETAMHAAETGHLVFSTIHTQDTKQTLDRVLDSFPPDQAHQIRQLFAQTLVAIVAQKLLRRKDTGALAVAAEVLINTPHISELLSGGKIGEIEKALQKGTEYYQMQSFNQDLMRLVKESLVTPEQALAHSPNPGDLKLMLRGLASGSSNIRNITKDGGGTTTGRVRSRPRGRATGGGGEEPRKAG